MGCTPDSMRRVRTFFFWVVAAEDSVSPVAIASAKREKERAAIGCFVREVSVGVKEATDRVQERPVRVNIRRWGETFMRETVTLWVS